MTQLQRDNAKRLAIYAKESFQKIVQNLMDLNSSRAAMDVITGKQFARIAGLGSLTQAQSSGSNANFMAQQPAVPVDPS